jgi:DNA polymerase-3 subunit delta'
MGWANVIGQTRVKNLLKRAIAANELAHAYLFYGLRGIGKQAMAIEFARTILCSKKGVEACGECNSCKKFALLRHPDLNLVFPLPVGKTETAGDDPIDALDPDQIDQVREQIRLKAENPYYEISIPKANFIKINSVRGLKRTSSMTSVEGSWKVFLLFDADLMNAEAGNSLLKTLEEPTQHTLLVLTTSEKDKLLPTIVSRCQLVQFSPLQDAEIAAALQVREHVSAEEAMLVAKVAQGSYTAASELLSSNLVDERAEVLRFIRASLGWKEVSLTEFIDGLASSNDRKGVEQWLKVLQTWLRDAMILRDAGGSYTKGMDTDKDMVSFVQKFPRANIERAIQCVEATIALVRKNVYLHLLLTTLSYDLRKTLIQEIV